MHQSTFDLTRHGMIIGGHATQSLPQVLLELEGDDIYAVGMLGLIYGRYDNLESVVGDDEKWLTMLQIQHLFISRKTKFRCHRKMPMSLPPAATIVP